jgi:DNA polymerase-3 subunit alpha
MISELETETIQRIFFERKRNGPFKDMYDFVNRVSVSIEQMRLLIRAGCFEFSGRNKKELLWEIHAILQPVSRKKQHEELFEIEAPEWKLPELMHSELEDAFDEIELFGFSLCSPFRLLRDPLPHKMRARELRQYIRREVVIVGYLINIKYTRTFKGERMYFGTFVDLDGDWIDTVHFPPSAQQFPFTGPGTYEIRGTVVEEYDFICIEANYLKRLPVIDREKINAVVA